MYSGFYGIYRASTRDRIKIGGRMSERDSASAAAFEALRISTHAMLEYFF